MSESTISLEQSVPAALLCLRVMRTSPFHTEVVRPPEFYTATSAEAQQIC